MTTTLYFSNFYRRVIIKHFPDWEIAADLKIIDDQIRGLKEISDSKLPFSSFEIVRLLKKYSRNITDGLTTTQKQLITLKTAEIQEFAKMAFDLCGFPPLKGESVFDEYVFIAEEIPPNKLIAVNEILLTKYDMQLEA